MGADPFQGNKYIIFISAFKGFSKIHGDDVSIRGCSLIEVRERGVFQMSTQVNKPH